jgi:choline-sulfatase
MRETIKVSPRRCPGPVATGLTLAAIGAALVGVACERKNAEPTVSTRPAVSSSVSSVSAPSAAASAPAAKAAASAPPAPPGPPRDANVLLITIDSLRADMPWAGYPRPIAPRLTAFAEKSVVYTRAYSISSYTSMSLGGMLAGRYPSELKRDGYFFGTYAKDVLMFPELLQNAKIKTLSAHGHGYFQKSGMEQGFDVWEIVDKLKWNNTTDENITSPQMLELAKRQLDKPELEQARFFAWYHFLDPHDRYLTHESVPPWGKTVRDRYDGEVTFTDIHVGKLLDVVAQKSWAPRTIIIVSADHGEAFGEHGQFAHGFELWENLVRVPLIVSAPGAPARRIDTPRSHIDLARTLLEIFGVEPDGAMRGKSLVREIYGGEAETRDVFLDLPPTSDNDRRRALVAGNRKVISSGAAGLKRVYDVVADPAENTPLKGDEVQTLVERFKTIDKEVVEIPPTKCREDCLSGAYAKKKDGGS